MRFSLFFVSVWICVDLYCPEGSFLVSDLGDCFLYSDLGSKAEDAEQICRLYGGHLTAIHNAFENGVIASYALKALGSTQAIIGLNRNDPDLKWQWVDGSNVEYFKWGQGQPSAGNCSSLKIDEMIWRTIDCSLSLPFICRFSEIQTTTPHSTTPDPNSVCFDGWKYFDVTDMCYYHGKESTFYDAEAFCQENHGHLASIHSDAENEFVKNLAYNTSCDRNDFHWMYGATILGGQINDNTNLTDWWTDGSDTDYTQMLCSTGSGANGNTIILSSFIIG
ncbi:unnamed protein product, partial [Mesorhabditis belari]|uniref:C-type lectin domain-containing protein n=1 Tax=Mesorhabditis belari TaxID=2138241 RepID=A0AAF3FDN8_9BILA